MRANAALPVNSVPASFNKNRKLVLVQLDGGNDGLNMVIPISQYDNLANARRNILVDNSQILRLTDETGLHPVMPELANLYKEGKIQIIQGVGYPNPNLSHFRSKDIVLSASDAATVISSGWLGRMFGQLYPGFPEGFPNSNQPHPISLTIGSTSSATCQGDLANYSTVLRNLSSSYANNLTGSGFPDTPYGKELQYIMGIMEQTEGYLSVIKNAASGAKNLSSKYPAAGTNPLADQLKIVANLVAGGLQTQVYVVSLGGWDTHSGQVTSETSKLTGAHPSLLGKLSAAIDAFQDDLKLLKKEEEVLGFVYTEFGRRIKSNDSLGTDHGTTWPAILFGSMVNPGIIGNNPVIPASASKTDNLSLQYDFRSIYASLYSQWFGLEVPEAASLIGGSFPAIPVTALSTSIDEPLPMPPGRIMVFPNPVQGEATLAFDADGSRAQIRIYSLGGQLVKAWEQGPFPAGSQQVAFSTGNLRPGVYLLILQQKSGKSETKIVVR